MVQPTEPEQLPDIPSGTELLDIVWRDLSPTTSLLLEVVPEDVEGSWATVVGVDRFWRAHIAAERARQALVNTPPDSCLIAIRKRAAQAAESAAMDCALFAAGALVARVRDDWPSAAPEQVWLLMARRLRVLCAEYVAASQGRPS